MSNRSWLRQLCTKLTRQHQIRTDRQNRDDLFPTLNVTRLEKRLVLNADAVPVAELVVDAGEAAGDGQADTFQLERDGSDIQVMVNGKEAGRAPAAELNSIKLEGSLDDDLFLVDLKNGDSLGDLDVQIDGGAGGTDVLQLVDGLAVEGVTHELSQAGSGSIEINASSGHPTGHSTGHITNHATIAYQGLETIQDRLVANTREFHFGQGSDHVTLGSSELPGDNFSRIGRDDSTAGDAEQNMSVTFLNPLDALRVDTVAAADSESDADTLEVTSLDATFNADLLVDGDTDDTLTFTGQTDLGSGDLIITGGEAYLAGEIATSSATVDLSVMGELTITDSGLIRNDSGIVDMEAASITQNGQILAAGGHVGLDSGDEGVTLVRGILDVSESDNGQTGGTIHVLGMHVGLLDQARIDASGAAGGGKVLVGGDYQGKTPKIRNAQRTYVGPETTIHADAGTMGEGGTVIVWADETTRFYGNISARGGAEKGDGGFAEVSGKESLIFQGRVDLTSGQGVSGTLLLDPKNGTITGAPNAGGGTATNITDNDAFADNAAGNTNFQVNDLLEVLRTANVKLQVNNDLTVNSALNAEDNTDGNAADRAGRSFTVQAGRNIVINASVTMNDGAITLTANETSANGVIDANRDAGAAVVTMADNTTIDAGNADITITMNTGTGLTNSTSGDITLENLTTTGDVLVVNNGPTSGSGIVIEGTNSDGLVTAASAAFDASGAGASGEVGTVGDPLRVTVSNLAARSQSGGAYFNSPAQGVTIGGAALGGLTGISTLSDGDIQLVADTGSIILNEAVSANGAGTVVIDATAANATVTVQASGDVDSGSGLITLRADGDITLEANGSVGAATTGGITITTDQEASGAGTLATNAGATIGNVNAAGAIALISNDLTLGAAVTGTGDLSLLPSRADTDVGVSGGAGTFNVSTGEIDLLTDGFNSITIGRADGTALLTVNTDTFLDPIAFRMGGADGDITTVGALSTTNDTITFIAGTGDGGTFTQTTGAGNTIASGSGAITVTADSIGLNTTANTITSTGAITLQPASNGRPIVIGAAGAATDFVLSTTELAALSDGAAGISIGRAATGAHAITIDTITFSDPVTIQAPAGAGSITVDGQITGTGNASITLDGPGATTTLNADITTVGQNITISDTVVIAEAATPTLATGAGEGNIEIAGTVNGTAGGVAEALTLDAGTGNITLSSAVSGAASAVNAMGLTTVTITAAEVVQTDAVNISGPFSTTNTLTGTFTSGARLTVGSLDLDGIAFNLNQGFDSAGIVNIDNTGLLTLAGQNSEAEAAVTVSGGVNLGVDIVTTDDLIDLNGTVVIAEGVSPTLDTGAGEGNIEIAGTVNGTAGGVAEALTLDAGTGNITLSSAVSGAAGAVNATGLTTVTITDAEVVRTDAINISGALTQTAGSDSTTLNGAVNVGSVSVTTTTLIDVTSTLAATGGGAITLTADEIDFNAVDSVSSTGTITLQPAADGVSIDIGFPVGETGTLDLSDSDLAALADGFSSITIGRLTGTHTIVMSSSSFRDPTTIQAPNGTGSITVDGQITGTDNASITLDGPNATTTLNADITTAGENITISDAVVIGDGLNITLTTGAGTGDILITGTTDGDPTTGAGETLTLTAGVGDVLFTGLVGDTTVLGAITISIANDVTTNGVRSASFVQTGGSGTTTLNLGDFTAGTDEAMATTAALGVNIVNETIGVNAGITTTGGGIVTLNAHTATLAIAAAGDIVSDGTVSLTGATGINTAGDVTTTADTVTYNSATVLSGGVLIDATSGNAAGNSVTFTSVLDGNQTLGITAGTVGDVLFTGLVGDTTVLGAITISIANDVTTNGVRSASFVQTGGSGTTTLNLGDFTAGTDEAMATTAALGVNIVNETIGVNAGITTTGGGIVTLNAHTATLAIAAAGDIVSDGTVSLTGATGINTAGDVTTTADTVTYNSATVLSGGVLIDATSGNAAGNSVTFTSVLDGNQTLGITAGTVGDVLFTGLVGDTTVLGAITISIANDVTTNGVRSASFVQTGGSGTTTLNLGDFTAGTDEAMATTAALGVNIVNETIGVNAGITTTGGGIVTLNAHTATLAIAAAGDIVSDGTVSLTGATGINTAGDVTTTADTVTYNSATVLSGGVLIDATSGNAAGNSVTFTSVLDGNQTLGITAGTVGDVLFTGLVGDTTVLGAITISIANDVTTNGVRSASFVQTGGSGTTTLNLGDFTAGTDEAMATTAALGVNIVNETIGVNAGITTTGGGIVTLNAHTATLAIAAAGDIVSDGTVSLTGATGINTAGDVTTTADTVTYNSATVLSGGVLIDATSGNAAGNSVTFTSVLDGNQTLGITAGTVGDVLFTGLVGDTTVLGAITISIANDVTADSAISAASLTQEDGTGTTTLNNNVTTSALGGVDINTNKIVLHNMNVVAGGTGTVTLGVAATVDNLDFQNVLITANGGRISDQVLARHAGRFTALDSSHNVNPAILVPAEGKISVQVDDTVGENFDIRVDWRQGDPLGPVSEPSNVAKEVTYEIDGSPPNARDLTHNYVTKLPFDNNAIAPGNKIRSLVSITSFAQGKITLKLNGTDILVDPGDPGGIQTEVLVPLTSIPGRISVLPTPELLPPAFAPPVIVANFQAPAQQPLLGTQANLDASAASSVAQTEEVRYYLLRIVSFDDQGNLVEWRAHEEVIEFRGRDRAAAEPEYPGLEPFDLTKLPDLFERLPDDRYRLYLYEDGTERLVLDFIIEQGRPVEAPEAQQPTAEPADDTDTAAGPQDPGVNGVDETENSETEHDETDPVDDLERSRLPENPAPAKPGLNDEGADLRQPWGDRVPESVDERSIETSFAERFGRESVVSHGGLIITAAALGRTTSKSRGRKNREGHCRESQCREESVDRIIRRFGSRRPFTGRNVTGRKFVADGVLAGRHES